MSLAPTMERRQGIRLGTDVPLVLYRDGVPFDCRAFDLSCGGALVYDPTERRPPLLQRVELTLDRRTVLVTWARTVWSKGSWQAVRFVGLHDVDRLDIAEHLDALSCRAPRARRREFPCGNDRRARDRSWA